MSESPFESRPDETLGRLLREHLTGPDSAAFIVRLRRALRDALVESPWESLSRWSRPGLVAAGVAAAVLGWVALGGRRTVEPAAPASVSAQVIVAGEQTAGDLLIAAVVEGR